MIKTIAALIFSMVIGTGLLSCSTPPNPPSESQEEIAKAIQQRLFDFAAAIKSKDAPAIRALFDDGNDVALVGSGSSEIRYGHAEINEWVLAIMEKPYLIHWDFRNARINSEGSVAWAFANGTMAHIQNSKEIKKIPYRLISVWVKRGNQWKLKLFNGSVPG